MLQLGWEKAFDETGLELAWWRDHTLDTAARARAARDRTRATRMGQSSRSGCSRTILAYSGWKLK